MNDIDNIWRGNKTDWITLTITGTDQSFEGYLVKFTAKKNKSDAFADAKIKINSDDHSGQFDLTQAVNRIIKFYFTAANTNLPEGQYLYDIELTKDDDTKTFPKPSDNAVIKIYDHISDDES